MHDEEPVFREARLDDWQAVAELKRRYGLGTDTLEKWKWLWQENPALGVTPYRTAMGWVVEVEGRVQGYIGNFPMLYRFGDETVHAAAGHGWVVAEDFRGYGIQLANLFMKQKEADLLLLTTPNEVSFKILSFLGARQIPSGNWNEGLFWIVTPSRALTAFLQHRFHSPFLARLGGMALAPALSIEGWLRRRGPRRARADLEVKLAHREAIGEEFDDLWMRKLREPPRLMTYRTAEALRWYLGVPGPETETLLFTCSRGSTLVGFAIVKRRPMEHVPITAARIVDLFVESDNPDIVAHLLRGIFEHAREAGDGILVFGMGFPEEIRRSIRAMNPHVRQAEGAPGLFRGVGPRVKLPLADESAWYATPIDGDGFLS